MDEELEEMRVNLLEQLRALQLAYQAAAKPIIDKLVEIENLRPPRPFIMSGRIIDAKLTHFP